MYYFQILAKKLFIKRDFIKLLKLKGRKLSISLNGRICFSFAKKYLDWLRFIMEHLC